MRRRDLLKAASATAGALAIHPLVTRADSVPGDVPQEADVVVVGGGTAGTVAAIQAARAGAKAVLIERGSQLGGTTTVGGVTFPGLFHAWGTQIISGIGQAAGPTAALAAKRKTTPLKVPFDEIARVLREHGAIVRGHS